MFTIPKDFTFSAAHALPSLPEDHKCHGCTATTTPCGSRCPGPDLDDHGMLIDYAELGFVGEYLDEHVDHQTITLYPAATAEVFAEFIHTFVRTELPPGLKIAVGFSETPRVWAWYR